MERRVLSTLVLLCTRMLFVSCFGRQADPRHEDVSVEDIKMPILNTSGCSYSRLSTYNCKKFELQCNGSRRIQILGSKYGEIPQQSVEAIQKTSNEAKGSATNTVNQNLRCPYCDGSWSDTLYNSNQRYDLFKRCSWKATCQPPAVGTNIAHLIPYRCVPEQPFASFCNPASITVTGQLINVIFDGSAFRKQYPAEIERLLPYRYQCFCDIKSNLPFRLSAADLRLLNAGRRCIPSARLFGLAEEETMCTSEQTAITTKEVVFSERRLTLSFDVAPEFIWIIIQAGKGEMHQQERLPDITVDCHSPTNPKPTTPAHETKTTTGTTTSTDKTKITNPETESTTSMTSSTDKIETTSTTSTTDKSETAMTTLTTPTGKTDSTSNENKSSTTPYSETQSTTASNIYSEEQSKKEFQADRHDGIPLPAIIVPIVVILIAAVVVVIFMWRRRLVKHKRKDDADEQTNVAYQVPVKNGQVSDYESAAPKRTDDNYLVLEQEHVYNTLDAEHNDSKTIKAKHMSLDQNNEYQTPEPRNNDMADINEENVYTPLNAKSMDTANNISPNETATIRSMSPTQTNEYFTLESQATISSGKPVSILDRTDTDSVDNIDPNETVMLQSMPIAQTNEYFKLEPQSTISSGKPVSISEMNDKQSVSGSADDFQIDSENNAARHDYFVLNPQPPPLAIYELGNGRVDDIELPTKDQDGEEIHNYFTLEPNDIKQN